MFSEIALLLLVLGWVVITTITVEVKRLGLSITSLAAFLLTVWFMTAKGWTDIPVFEFVKANALNFCIGLALYLVIGLCWAVIRWAMFVKAERRKYDEVFAKHKSMYGGCATDWTAEQFSSFRSEFKYSYDADHIEFRPKIENFKEEFFLWMFFWPFSLLWTMIDDPVRRLCRAIYDMIGSRLQAISDSVWRGTSEVEERLKK